jgi:hypothetical protein
LGNDITKQIVKTGFRATIFRFDFQATQSRSSILKILICGDNNSQCPGFASEKAAELSRKFHYSGPQ